MASLILHWKKACFLVVFFFYGCLCCSLVSEKCVRSPASADEMSMRLKLIHLYSPESPYYQPGLSLTQKLSNLMEMDRLRLSQFQLSSMIRTQQQKQGMEYVGDDNPRSNIFSGVSVGLGQYLVEFMLGSPAQKFLLIVDTGSDLVWVQCYPCHGCSSSLDAGTFLPQNSSTFFQLPCSSDACFQVPAPAHDTCSDRYPSSCRYLYRYADDSSSSGILCTDTVTLNSTSSRRVQFAGIAFGCGSRNAGSFKKASGVLGLGQGDISFVSQLSQSYIKFSYCLGDYLKPRLSTSLILFTKGGAAGDESLKSSFRFTPLVRNSLISTFYYVKVREVSVGAEGVLPIPDYVWEIDLLGNGGTVIDSGSTLSVFKLPAYSLILGAFERSIHYPRTHSFQGLDLCFNVSGVSQPLLPSFFISFDGDAVFQPPPANYFVEVEESVRCLAIQGTSSPLAFNVVGNLLQQNFYMQFDRGNAQLGFAQANCSQL